MNINKHEMSDDELDHLFRDSAEKMDFDFDPDSWTKMSQKLDAVAPPPSGSRGVNPRPKRSLLLLIGLLVFVGGYYSIKSSTNQSSEVTEKTSQASKNERKDTDSKKYVTTNKVDTDNLVTNENTKTDENKTNSNSSTNSTTSNKEEITAKKASASPIEITKGLTNNKTVEKTAVTAKPVAPSSALNSDKGIVLAKNIDEEVLKKNTNSSTVVKRNSAGKSEKTTFASTKSEAYSSNNTEIFKTKGAKNQKRSAISSGSTNADEHHINALAQNSSVENTATTQLSNAPKATLIDENRLALNNLDFLAPKGTFIKSSIALPIVAFENPQPQAPTLPKSTPQSFKKGLYLRVGISPDLSLVTADELTKLGSNSALLLEYRFNKRLSVQGGVLRSMKYYDAYPESYEWPYNWPSPPKLIDINATCKMLDIPLSIRYDISQKPLSRWFVSFGATSYIMLNEKYVYNYENPYDPKIKWKTWQGKTGTYYLGVLNFSVGYEYQLFRKLSIQAEPFFKMPIARVGFGQVNLSTLGLLVSAKYPIFTHK